MSNKINLELNEIRTLLLQLMFPISDNDFLNINNYIDEIFGETQLSTLIKDYYSELISNLYRIVKEFNDKINTIFEQEEYSNICRLIKTFKLKVMLSNINQVFSLKYQQLQTLYATLENGIPRKRIFNINAEYSDRIKEKIGLINKYISVQLKLELKKRKEINMNLIQMCYLKESQAGGSKKRRKRKYKKKKTRKNI